MPRLVVVPAVAAALLAATGPALLATPPATAAVTCHGLAVTIVGTPGDDDLIGTPERDVVFLDAGDDSWASVGGADVVCGGEGDDVITGGAETNHFLGEGGNDVLRGAGGSDNLRGGDGDDRIVGGEGRDIVDGGLGSDRLDGGAGNNALVYAGQGSLGVRVDLAAGTSSRGGADRFVHFSRLYASPGPDVVLGTEGRDWIHGAGGTDRIWTRGGRDSVVVDGGEVHAGPGDDAVGVHGSATAWLGDGNDYGTGDRGTARIRGEGGNDLLIHGSTARAGSVYRGGPGEDSLRVEAVTRGITLDLAAHTGTVKVWSIEHLTGSELDDVIRGTDGEDHLHGGAGNDRLYGRGDFDQLYGDGGRDTVDGGAHRDYCLAEVRIAC